MNYIMSEGPEGEINQIEGTESPVWFVTEYDDNDNMVKDYGTFYTRDAAVEFADKEAKKRRIEHVCDAGRA